MLSFTYCACFEWQIWQAQQFLKGWMILCQKQSKKAINMAYLDGIIILMRYLMMAIAYIHILCTPLRKQAKNGLIITTLKIDRQSISAFVKKWAAHNSNLYELLYEKRDRRTTQRSFSSWYTWWWPLHPFKIHSLVMGPGIPEPEITRTNPTFSNTRQTETDFFNNREY